MKVIILSITFIISVFTVTAQSMAITAKTYRTDDTRMSGVTIQIWEGDKMIATQKTENGMVWLYNCNYGKVYKFTYISKGYLTRHLVFDLRNIPIDVSQEKSAIDVDMTMYKKKELSGCKSQLADWESKTSGTLEFDPTKSEFTWKCEEGNTMKTEIEACRVR